MLVEANMIGMIDALFPRRKRFGNVTPLALSREVDHVIYIFAPPKVSYLDCFVVGIDRFNLDPVVIAAIADQQVCFHIVINGRNEDFPTITSKPTGGLGFKRGVSVILVCGNGALDLFYGHSDIQ